jgi:hypothetical protein
VASPSTSVPGACTLFGTAKTEAAGATSTTVTVPAGSAQRYLLLKVTAINTAGTAVKTMATSQQIWEAPAISSATGAAKPTTTGTANVGQRINVNNGTWVGFPNPTPSYKWYVCDSAIPTAAATLASGVGCVLTATTSAYYDITLAEGGKFLVAGITQTNSAGSGAYYSASTVQIGYEPRATEAPSVTITGGADKNYVSSVLNATLGTWAGYTTPGTPALGTNAYQWYACNAAIATPATSLPSGGVCTAIANANSSTFTLTDAQAGKHVAVYVTQQNKINATGVSNYVAVPTQVTATGTKLSTSTYVRQAPKADSATGTSLTGRADVGGTVTVSATTWSGFPTPATNATGVEWYLCAKAETVITNCELLASETSRTVNVVSAFAGKYLWTRSWAENSVGRTTTVGVKTQVISEAPVALTAPVLTTPSAGTPTQPKVGQSISTTDGTWRSTAGNAAVVSETRTYSYSWYSCPAADSLLAACALRGTVDSAIKSYTPTSNDNGKFITVVVKAKNLVNSGATGATTTQSAAVPNQSALIGPVNYAPTNSGDVSLSSSGGAAVRVGDTLTITGESWSAEPAVTSRVYAWYSCTSRITSRPTTDAIPTGCAVLSEANSSSLTVTTTLGNKHVIAKVTATNAIGSTFKWTLSTTSAVTQSPQGTGFPTLVGTPQVGQTVTVSSTATWTGFPAPTLGYRWFSCVEEQLSGGETQPAGCSVITGQTTKNLVLSASLGLEGKHIIVEEKATSTAGTATRFSASVGPIVASVPPVTP